MHVCDAMWDDVCNSNTDLLIAVNTAKQQIVHLWSNGGDPKMMIGPIG